MAVVEEKPAEAVRKYTVLYDKADKFKRLAWEDASCHDKRRWDRGGCYKGGKFYIFKIKSSITKGHFLHQRMKNTLFSRCLKMSLAHIFRTFFLFLVAFVDDYVLIINTPV